MRTKWTGLIILCTVALFACNNGNEQSQETAVAANGHKVVVKEVIQTSAYTYLNVEEAGSSSWLAVTRREVEPGATLYHQGGLEMKNFESKELKRTFEAVYFVDGISDQPISASTGKPAWSPHKPASDAKTEISVEKADGGISIAELFARRSSHANQKVKVRGQVTKYNSGIMGRNWVHLQDGTKDSGNFDITVTTNDQVKVGDVVVFEGTVILNKDFGAGYSYEVIVEDARVLN